MNQRIAAALMLMVVHLVPLGVALFATRWL